MIRNRTGASCVGVAFSRFWLGVAHPMAVAWAYIGGSSNGLLRGSSSIVGCESGMNVAPTFMRRSSW